MSLLLNRTTFGSAADKGTVLSRQEADTRLHEWVVNDRLKLHMKQVAKLMHEECTKQLQRIYCNFLAVFMYLSYGCINC